MALSMKIRFFLRLIPCFCAAPFGILGDTASAQDAPINYQKQIRPIIVDHCLACHGVDADTREGGLRLDRKDDALRGGESQKPAIVPGKPDESELIRRITSLSPMT